MCPKTTKYHYFFQTQLSRKKIFFPFISLKSSGKKAVKSSNATKQSRHVTAHCRHGREQLIGEVGW
jgi:hypothetical protein